LFECQVVLASNMSYKNNMAEKPDKTTVTDKSPDKPAPVSEQTAAEPFSLSSSRGFNDWLAASGGSIAFTTYQAGKLFLIGVNPDGRLSVFERTFPRCMGLAVSSDARQLFLATLHQIYRFDNAVPSGQLHEGYDALYTPRASWVTGDLDVHDVMIGRDGRPIFVNTLFGCLATVSDGYSFKPLWRPPFISRLAAEDRCHLNGVAGENGIPRYVSACSTSDVSDGWRDSRVGGGVIVDVAENKVILDGLTMPHSPRLHDGKLWLLNSGSGELGFHDPDGSGGKGSFEPLAFCPGYARGLAFAGDLALVGLSLARDNRTFQGLGLEEALEKKNASARCGLQIVDLKSGDAIHWIRIEGVVQELYDVAFLPGVRRPSAIGFKTTDISRIITVEETASPDPTK